jgi:hypothetical protein
VRWATQALADVLFIGGSSRSRWLAAGINARYGRVSVGAPKKKILVFKKKA